MFVCALLFMDTSMSSSAFTSESLIKNVAPKWDEPENKAKGSLKIETLPVLPWHPIVHMFYDV